MFGTSHSTRTSRFRRTTRTSGNPRGGFFSSGNSPTGGTGTRRGLFRRADPDRRAGGYKAALHNPNTTREGRKHAKHELRMMGRGNEAHGHPSLKSRIKHVLGIRSRGTTTRGTARTARTSRSRRY